jgi:hypothetical protein
MDRSRLLYSVVNIDGDHKLMLAYEYLQSYLTGSELEEYLADFEIFYAYEKEAMMQGKLILTPIYETITTQDGDQKTIQIGVEIQRDQSSPKHELIPKWINRFKNDPAVVKFYDEEPL